MTPSASASEAAAYLLPRPRPSQPSGMWMGMTRPSSGTHSSSTSGWIGEPAHSAPSHNFLLICFMFGHKCHVGVEICVLASSPIAVWEAS